MRQRYVLFVSESFYQHLWEAHSRSGQKGRYTWCILVTELQVSLIYFLTTVRQKTKNRTPLSMTFLFFTIILCQNFITSLCINIFQICTHLLSHFFFFVVIFWLCVPLSKPEMVLLLFRLFQTHWVAKNVARCCPILLKVSPSGSVVSFWVKHCRNQ